MSVDKESRKETHRKSLRLLAALALEHGLRLIPSGEHVRKLIEEDIAVVRRGVDSEIATRYRAEKKLRGFVTYSAAGLLFQSSVALLDLSRHLGNPPAGIFQMVCYFPVEAGYLISAMTRDPDQMQHEEMVERNWQDKHIRPLEDRIFREFGEPIEIPDSAQECAA